MSRIEFPSIASDVAQGEAVRAATVARDEAVRAAADASERAEEEVRRLRAAPSAGEDEAAANGGPVAGAVPAAAGASDGADGKPGAEWPAAAEGRAGAGQGAPAQGGTDRATSIDVRTQTVARPGNGGAAGIPGPVPANPGPR